MFYWYSEISTIILFITKNLNVCCIYVLSFISNHFSLVSFLVCGTLQIYEREFMIFDLSFNTHNPTFFWLFSILKFIFFQICCRNSTIIRLWLAIRRHHRFHGIGWLWRNFQSNDWKPQNQRGWRLFTAHQCTQR